MLVPVTLVAVFGIVSSNWVRMISGPTSGFLANRMFKSSASLMRILFLVGVVIMGIIIVVPKDQSMVWPVTILLIILQVAVYMLRGIYYAPIGESGIPKEVSGAAMAVAILMIQSPMLWGFATYGSILDSFPRQQAYTVIFGIMMALYGVGFVASSILLGMIKRRGLKIDVTTEKQD
jgi:hypothetical protein